MTIMACLIIPLLKFGWDLSYLNGYDPSAPLNVQSRSEEDRAGYHRIEFTYEAYPGQPVPALMALPREGTGPFPALVFLHGIGQDKEFLDEIGHFFTEAGFAFVTFDQYMQGERKLRGVSLLKRAVAIRERGALTINETRRLVDYLDTRPDIAPDRIYLIGASYGAMMGSIVGALEKRFQAVSLCYGGGNFAKFTAYGKAKDYLGPLVIPAARFTAWFMAPCEPIRYVGLISPRPIFCQNGEKDRIVVPEAAKALYEAAREPKQIKWYPSDHLDLDPEYIEIAIHDGIAWFKEQDARVLAAKGVG